MQFVGHWLADWLAGGVVGVNVPPDAQDWAVYKYSSLGTGWPIGWLVVRREWTIYLYRVDASGLVAFHRCEPVTLLGRHLLWVGAAGQSALSPLALQYRALHSCSSLNGRWGLAIAILFWVHDLPCGRVHLGGLAWTLRTGDRAWS